MLGDVHEVAQTLETAAAGAAAAGTVLQTATSKPLPVRAPGLVAQSRSIQHTTARVSSFLAPL